jgi:hypothetical protein
MSQASAAIMSLFMELCFTDFLQSGTGFKFIKTAQAKAMSLKYLLP